ncbi:MAG: hypothetical protein RIS51_785 [Actinomycetota bacterium]
MLLSKATLSGVTKLIAALVLALFTVTGISSTSFADSVNEDMEFAISGNVKNEGQPLTGVRIVVTGPGYEAETVTDSEGRWLIGVPTQDKYKVFLDETTLPEGIAVLEGGAEQEVEIGQGGRVTKNFFIGEGARQAVNFSDQLIQRIFLGVNFGLMLALAAIGLSLVFGTTGLSNFAHSEMVTFGALGALLFANLGLPLIVAIILAIVLSAALGYGLDAALWKPLRKRGLGLVQLMIVSIGLALTGRYIFQFLVGGGTIQLPGYDTSIIQLGPIAVSPTDLASMALSVVVLLGFAYWLLFTRIGKATRAISDNIDLAAASGIDVDRVIRIVWIMASALAGLAGILWAYFRPGIKWDMGAQILLLIFAAVTLGGLGTAFGALVGALVVGLLVETSSLFIPADLKYVGALVVLIAILLLRPQGILGKKGRIG